jgi:hypothetical protein
MSASPPIFARTPGVAETPGRGWCLRCGRTNDHAAKHFTGYCAHAFEHYCAGPRGGTWCSAIAPLCEACWTMLGTPQARLPYYESFLADASGSQAGDDTRAYVGLVAPLILLAVCEGR